MEKTVLIISTLDTKGPETAYLRDQLRFLGLETLLMDVSLRPAQGLVAPALPAAVLADIPPDEVARAAGKRLEEIHASRDRARITSQVIAGAGRLARELLERERIQGVIGLGGSTGSLMATEVMRTLPFGFPKFMVSSTAALPGLSTRYIGTGDIALFHSVIELAGLSAPLRNVLDRAAGAVAGMIQGPVASPRADKGKAIALTMLGPCEKCAAGVRRALEEAGFQVIGFSAAGIGDRAMEDMISQGLFQGVVDLAPGGVGEHLFGFMRDAGPRRLESAGKAGLPQVIAPCSVNHATPAKSRYRPEDHARRKYDLDKYRTWLRLTPDELRQVAGAFAAKLNPAGGPVRVVIPLRGWSSVDAPGNPTYDPAEDRSFVDALRGLLKADIPLREVDANLEDPDFTRAVVEAALEIF